MSLLLLFQSGTSATYTRVQELVETFTGNSTVGDITTAGRADLSWALTNGTSSTMNVNSGHAQMAANGTGAHVRSTSAVMSQSDSYVTATFVHDGDAVSDTGLQLRIDPTSQDRYAWRARGTSQYNILRYNGTVATSLIQVTGPTRTAGVAHTLAVEAIGNTLIGYYNGVEVTRVTDSSPLTSGGLAVGFQLFANGTAGNVTADDWSAGRMAVATMSALSSSFFFAA